jgi:ribosomal protein S12 methylthiotransferase
MYSPEDISYTIISLGCAKNQTDSERLNGGLNSAGFTYSDSLNDSDIIIVNTCGFIEDAKTESISVILEAAELCTDGSSEIFGKKKLVVNGCLSQRYFEELKKELPEIDLLYGLTDKALSDKICSEFNVSCSKQQFQRELLAPAPYEYIKIAEGCSNNCTFCAIPLIRGQFKAAPVDAILKDARRAVERGAKELVIIAQDIAAYNYNGIDLYSLIEKISELNGKFWIRLMYAHPDKIDNRFISILKDIPKVVPYLDIPLQHVNETLLRSMNRRGSYSKYKNLIQTLREEIPGIAIRTTFMVGFPGETDAEFDELMKFVKETPFDRGGVFRYSREENTRAYSLPGAVEESVSIQRFNQLTRELEEGFLNQLEKRVNTKVEVLVEENSSENSWIGRSSFDAPEVDGVFFLTAAGKLENTIVEARITETSDLDLIGEI